MQAHANREPYARIRTVTAVLFEVLLPTSIDRRSASIDSVITGPHSATSSMAHSEGADTSLPERVSYARLNFDILACIMACVHEREDLLSFMFTCSVLYAAGVPLLLRRFPRCIHAKSLWPFNKFLLSNAPASFSALRILCFSYQHDKHREDPIVGSQDRAIVANILQQATRLECLALHKKYLGQSGHSDDAVARAIASLTALRRLALGGSCDNQTRSILTQLQSPIWLLAVEFLESTDVLPLLANFCHTLRHAEISSAKFLSSSAPYPHLGYLELSRCSQLRLSVLGPAFPALKLFVVSTVDTRVGEVSTDAMREENLQFQQGRSTPVWKLSGLIADLESLYILCLQFQVPGLTVTRSDPETYNDLTWLHDSMAYLQPQVFQIRGLSESCYPTDLSDFFNRDKMSELARVTICSELSDEDFEYHEYMIMLVDDLTVALAGFNSDGFKLILAVHAFGKCRDFLDGLDVDPLARIIMDMIPAVEVVEFECVGHVKRTRRWLRHNQDGVTEVSPSDYYEPITAEELWACYRELYGTDP
ncbi:hypothetical protein NM688_g7358 [Phlebia brevispora]|uniref:Uncharacterized protein n=1 Tax=Phlebia brevispora TaxID=194682 RepID=A0ACC1S632_9APHY|nr:hypothetical protein NM688_g7358 [Phlebia brevispora]